ncbi:MAG: methyltransferase domain-containing protein [Burkholderiaceae bacterium]|nr:methyltransferase domain-containing protein [Burkholderiaceae bacterium]
MASDRLLADPHAAGADPSPWIVRFAHLVPAGAQVLDVACGGGRHTRFFAARGCAVDAVDRDATAAAALSGEPLVRFLAADLENGPWPYAGQRFDAVIVTNYLHRPLFPHLRQALADGGVLLYETFAAGQEAFGRPSNPAFLLQPGELLQAFGAHLHVLAYEDGLIAAPRPARVQRLCALRLGARRPAALALSPEALRLGG